MPTQDLSNFVPEVWSKMVLRRLDQINVMLPLVSRAYEGEIKQEGDTVWVRTYGNVSLSRYQRGQPINYNALAPTKESLKINDAQYFAINVDDLDEAQMDINALKGYTNRAAVGVSNTIEAKLLSFWASALTANKLDDGTVAAATNSGAGHPVIVSAVNGYELMVKAGKALDKANAPQDGRWIVVDPDYKSQLLLDTKFFIRSTDLGDSIIRSGRLNTTAKNTPGFIGQCSKFDVYVSNALPTNVGGDTICQYGAGQVISYAGQIRKVEQIRRETTFGSTVRGLILHDGIVFAENSKAFGTIQKTTA